MIIPIGDDNSRRQRFPIVTWVIAGICAWLWYRQLQGGAHFTMAWSAVPYEITNNRDLITDVPLEVDGHTELLHHTRGPTPIQLTLLSSMFLHGGWAHLLGNMLYLLVFADQIEDRLGRLRFAIFYLLCGLVAGLAQVLAEPDSIIPTLGASGAIAGALGAYLVTHPRNRIKVLIFVLVVHLPAWLVLLPWIILQILAVRSMPPGQVSGVAYLAHIGGFIAGAILVHVMTPREKTSAT